MRYITLLAVVLLAIQSGLVTYSAWCHSPVYNEAGHLAAGLSHLQFARFDLFRVNPPLVRIIAALPFAVLSYSAEWKQYDCDPLKRSEYAVASEFLHRDGSRALWLVTVARWACIPFVLLGGAICFLWARDLYGAAGGLLALAVWCFSPAIVGHGALVIPDAHAAGVGLGACYAFWLWLQRSSARQAVIAGIALGLAELCKFTLLAFYPTWLLLWLIYRVPERSNMGWRDWTRQAGMFGCIVLLSLYIINVGYLFEGSFKRLGDYRFQTMALTGAPTLAEVPVGHRNRFADTWLGRLPVPLPENYIQGIDTQRLDFERGMKSYIGGEWRDRGWWYYYLYASAIKIPLGTWTLVVLASVLAVGRRGYSASWRDEMTLLMPMAAILILVSSQSGFSVHSRYGIPALPFLFVWVGKGGRTIQLGYRAVAIVLVGALAWSIGSSLWHYPHSLAYFNELVSGPRGGGAYLLDSNISWGQDLLYLKRWLDAHPEAARFHLVYFGQVDPRVAEIDFTLPDEEAGPLPGWYGMDVNHLHGSDLQVADGKGKWRCFDGGAFRYFQRFQAVALAGYSIYVYHITLDEANRVRRELGLPQLSEDRWSAEENDHVRSQ